MVETPRAPIVILATLLLHTTMAFAGDSAVGTATLDLQDQATGRKVTARWDLSIFEVASG